MLLLTSTFFEFKEVLKSVNDLYNPRYPAHPKVTKMYKNILKIYLFVQVALFS